MLEETQDELHDIEACGPVSRTSMFSILEGDSAIFHFNDPAVGDGHFEDIRCQVFQRRGTISNGLTIDNPVDFPDRWLDLSKQTGLIHLFFELCAEDRRESLDGDIEISS